MWRVPDPDKFRARFSASLHNEDAITRFVGAVLLVQNDEGAVGRTYMTLE